MISLIKEVLGVNDLAKSIYTLAKYNNGYFKSPAQAQVLKGQLDRRMGSVASGEMYGNGYTDWAEYDDRGITRIWRHLSKTNQDKDIFTRKSDEEFSDSKSTQIDNANKNFLDTISIYEQEMQEVSDDLKASMEQKPEKAESFQRILDSTMEKYQSRIADLEDTINQLKAKIK